MDIFYATIISQLPTKTVRQPCVFLAAATTQDWDAFRTQFYPLFPAPQSDPAEDHLLIGLPNANWTGQRAAHPEIFHEVSNDYFLYLAAVRTGNSTAAIAAAKTMIAYHQLRVFTTDPVVLNLNNQIRRLAESA